MTATKTTKPTFFTGAADFEAWLAANHDRETEILVGFWKKGAKKTGLTYKEALDAALCWGWIDAVRRSIDDERWTIRFTRRKPKSIWSNVNVARVEQLEREGRMRAAGRKAFEAREASRTGVYSFERPPQELDATAVKALRASRAAWTFWDAQPPSYKRVVAHWLASAKKDETRARRIASLVACCARGERLPHLSYGPKKKTTK